MKSFSVSVGDSDYNVAIHHSPSNAKAPLLVYVNQVGNSTIGCYVYTVPSKNTSYASVLQGVENGELHDFTANLGRVLVKKFGCPSYVLVSGSVGLYDSGELAKCVVEHVKPAGDCGQ